MAKNLYQLYIENGNKADFWVKDQGWSVITRALVVTVQGKTEGELEGKYPFFGNPVVVLDYYSKGQFIGRQVRKSGMGNYKWELIGGVS